MKTKVVDKKGEKRSLSETSTSVKLNQNVNELDKSPKRAKFAKFGSKQNGNPTLGEKAPIFKDRQKRERNKIVKQQSSIVEPSKIKRDTTAKTKSTIVELKKEITSNKARRLGSRKKRSFNAINLTEDQIIKKIQEIKSREELSKRAKRILGILNRKLKEYGNVSEKLDTIEKKSNKKVEYQANILMKNKQKVNNDDKTKPEKKRVQSKDKPQEIDDDDEDDDDDDDDDVDDDVDDVGVDVDDDDDDDDDDDEDDDDDVDDDEDEDEEDSDIGEESDEIETKNALVNNKKEEIDESDEDEEDLEDEEIDDEEDEEEVEDEEDEEDEENEEDEEDDKSEEDIIKKTKVLEERTKELQNKNKQVPQPLDNQKKEEIKKKQYVLFVGNLPYTITENEIKQHFLTKVDRITSIRIPTKPDKTPRGFAYVEVTNNKDFEKGLSLNHTFLKKRRINVEISVPKGGRKTDTTKEAEAFVTAKKLKLQAQRTGKKPIEN